MGNSFCNILQRRGDTPSGAGDALRGGLWDFYNALELPRRPEVAGAALMLASVSKKTPEPFRVPRGLHCAL